QLQHIPAIQVSSALAGAFVATEIVLFLEGDSPLANRLLQYSADYHRYSIFDVPRSVRCPRHQENESHIVDSGLERSTSIREFLERTQETVGEEILMTFKYRFIVSMDCESCHNTLPIRKFENEVYDKQRWCDECLEKGCYKEIPVSANWESFPDLNLRNRKR